MRVTGTVGGHVLKGRGKNSRQRVEDKEVHVLSRTPDLDVGEVETSETRTVRTGSHLLLPTFLPFETGVSEPKRDPKQDVTEGLKGSSQSGVNGCCHWMSY